MPTLRVQSEVGIGIKEPFHRDGSCGSIEGRHAARGGRPADFLFTAMSGVPAPPRSVGRCMSLRGSRRGVDRSAALLALRGGLRRSVDGLAASPTTEGRSSATYDGCGVREANGPVRPAPSSRRCVRSGSRAGTRVRALGPVRDGTERATPVSIPHASLSQVSIPREPQKHEVFASVCARVTARSRLRAPSSLPGGRRSLPQFAAGIDSTIWPRMRSIARR